MGRLKEKGRFYHGKKAHSFRNILTGTVLFLAVTLFFCLGLDNLADRTREEQKKSIEEAVWHGITQCYAIEGRYPESLEYLKAEYGIRYDTDQFFVDYQILGANIMPDVTVIEKE